MNIDVNGTLWVDVEEVDKVNRVIVTEPKSKFCKVFYTDPIPETRFTPSEEYVKPKADTYPETAKRIVGKSRDGMTLWYQCNICNEPVDAQDNYCRGCGRRLIDG